MANRQIFFDANGQVGFGNRCRPEFATCLDLLGHMDRLGIDRSLVWNTQARDHHPTTGNRRLLAELDALDDRARLRLAPSLVIAPLMLYERSSVQDLIETLQARRIRALRLFPATQRYNLGHLEPLLEQLGQFKPVLFLNVMEVSDEGDLLDFAQRFPDTPIVCTQGMWPHIFNFSLLNVMRQRPNVLIDNSWHHTAGTLERIIEDFGSGRMVFATGGKSHNGASIAQLLKAGIGAEHRHDIAHRNLERLLDLPPTLPAAQCDDPPTRGQLWRQFLAGEGPGVEIIDAHGHVGAMAFWPMMAQDSPDQLSAAVKEMDRVGIDKIIVSEAEALEANPLLGNLSLEKKTVPYRNRFMGYLGFNPYYEEELVPRLDEFFSRDFFVGFKFLCDYWQVPVTDKRFRPAYAYANRHRLPLLLHTWGGPYDSPAMLKDIVREFPDAIFLLGHSGGGDDGRREAVELARANPNVYLEWCGSFCSGIPWEETITQVGSDRVVFGTDAFGHDQAWELGRFLSLDLPAQTLLPILGQNIRRILAGRKK